MNFQQFVGRSAGPVSMSYTWRDLALYALAVGAGPNDLRYTYEKDLVALPSYAAVPYWSAINCTPQRPRPYPACKIVKEALERELSTPVVGLHAQHSVRIVAPIPSGGGALLFEDTITHIFDRGPGKGIAVRTSMPVHDGAGRLLAENTSTTIFFAGGGFGGEAMPKEQMEEPKRKPDHVVDDCMSPTQNLLYRLTGDTNLVHVDPDAAKAAGQERPFMHGLCSFGFATRMAIQALAPGEPERVTQLGARMRAVCFPGSRIQLQIWGTGPGNAAFKLVNAETGEAILDQGVFAYNSR